MKYSRRLIPFFAAGALAAAGCDDDSSSNPPPPDDMLVQPDQSQTDRGVIDMAEVTPDMDLDMDVVDPDMAADMEVIPDQMVDQMVDQEVDQMIDASTRVEPGPACADDDACGEFESCLDELCTVDFRPDVFVVSAIRIVEPMRSAELISTFLGPAVTDHQLNLIVEPGGYNDMGEYLWYIGNGGYYRATGDYDYIRTTVTYPIQNFYGFWREEEGLVWRPDGQTLFSLAVPAGTAEDENGDEITCLAQLVTTVDISIRPSLDENGLPMLNIQLIGVLTQEDAERVQIPIGGNRFPLTDLLNPEDLNIDQDGDGEFDAYPFYFDVDASSVVFRGEPPLPDGSNRDPAPDFMNPAACEQ